MTASEPAVDVHDLIATRQWPALREALGAMEPPEVADLLPALAKDDRVLLFRVLPRGVARDVFAHLSVEPGSALPLIHAATATIRPPHR